MSRTIPQLPLPVTGTLRRLGRDIRTARLRRRLRAAVVAERAQISLPTLARVEQGEAGVSLGIYATVLWVLGLLDPLSGIASPARDLTGAALEEERLPQRIRTSRQARTE